MDYGGLDTNSVSDPFLKGRGHFSRQPPTHHPSTVGSSILMATRVCVQWPVPCGLRGLSVHCEQNRCEIVVGGQCWVVGMAFGQLDLNLSFATCQLCDLQPVTELQFPCVKFEW